MTREQAADDEKPDRLSLRGLLARLIHTTEPEPRKRPDDQGRREVRGD